MINYEARPYGVFVNLMMDEGEYQETFGEAPTGVLGITQWFGQDIYIYVGDENPATLVHEIIHAVLFILEHVQIDPQAANGEPMAYLVDNMFTHFMEGFYGSEGEIDVEGDSGREEGSEE